ncbi:hypothetical protein CEP54_005136 [Fusarium duplospermum]|uniref:Uncharacterized protein n=1 Tax=Fusarium duplospermum TaxID=1325734 RepID=A0A428QDZ4_9HYPO|nr:hypothetical protein CEP54_005136 [Fusarium duplospermum]
MSHVHSSESTTSTKEAHSHGKNMEPTSATDPSPSTASNAGSFIGPGLAESKIAGSIGIGGQNNDGIALLDRWLNETPKDEPFHGLASLNTGF